jgi:hypothetical protein
MVGGFARALVRATSCVAFAALVTGCGGGGSSPLYANGTCNPGGQVQLTSPSSGQTAVSTSTNQIVIVLDGNQNTFAYNYQSWYVVLTSTSGTNISSGSFNPYADPNAYHPFTNDFYYNASLNGLTPNTTYGVKLQLAGNSCTPVTLGSFST